MSNRKSRFLKCDSGATAIEYGLIAVVVIGSATTIGTNLKTKFTSVSTTLK
jgi:pilus assembly protein Flp/PilA